ncbi:MAG: MotA/TolQ/ExbB proton channel family protein [Phycisphaerae bacterium]
MSLSVCVAATLLGQAATAARSSVDVTSIFDLVVKGGPVMIPIGLCSLIALGLTVERLVSLRRPRVIPPGLLAALEAARGENGDMTDDRAAALSACERDDSPLSRILAVGLRNAGQPIERIERRVDEAGQREVHRLRRYLRALSLIASLSTLLGLLGTITGMIRAFQTIASMAQAMGRTELLARGIYEAMITTAAGLIVAIPTMVAYHALASRIERLVAEMDEIVVKYVERLHSADERAVVRPPAHAAPLSVVAAEA